MSEYELYLCHHGVKGMKWGVRKKNNEQDLTRRNYKTGAKVKKTIKNQAKLIGGTMAFDFGMKATALAVKEVVGGTLVYTNPAAALGYKVVTDLLFAGWSGLAAAEVGRATIDIGVDAVSTFMHNRRVSKR